MAWVIQRKISENWLGLSPGKSSWYEWAAPPVMAGTVRWVQSIHYLAPWIPASVFRTESRLITRNLSAFTDAAGDRHYGILLENVSAHFIYFKMEALYYIESE